MSTRVAFSVLFCVGLMAALIACGETDRKVKVDASKLSEEARLGYELFKEKDCARCHSLGERRVTRIENGEEVEVPDLTNPFISDDSLYTLAHFKSIDQSQMPLVELNHDELRQVTRFIAELHAATNATVTADQADTRCPVCGAPVLITEATDKGLWISYLGDTYYFECDACKETFAVAPEVYRNRMEDETEH